MGKSQLAGKKAQKAVQELKQQEHGSHKVETPTSVKKLSGTTLNMRFMQRRQQQSVSNSPAQETINKDDSNTPAKSPIVNQQRHVAVNQQQQQATTKATTDVSIQLNTDDNDDMDIEKHETSELANLLCLDAHIPASLPTDLSASLFEMYGNDSYLPGRRSFNGFNKVIQRNYEAAQNHDNKTISTTTKNEAEEDVYFGRRQKEWDRKQRSNKKRKR
jgi:M-phase phosphoprotein 6